MASKRLRNCSAHVNVNNRGFCTSYELVSYETPVALLGMVDGEVYDEVTGEVFEHHGVCLYLGDAYDCSTTTMSHVRKFIEDYIGVKCNISDIREALKTDNILCSTYGGNVAVARATW